MDMSNDKGFRPMSHIVAELNARIEDIEQGRLDLEGMDAVLDDIRELEERLIVIRYKGIEKLKRELQRRGAIEAVDTSVGEQEQETPAPPVAKESEIGHQTAIPQSDMLIDHSEPGTPEVHEVVASEQGLIDKAIDKTEHASRPEELVEEEPQNNNQISLIDSIEELSREASINEKMKGQNGPTVAQKLSGSKVADLSKAFSLNERIGIIKELFGGDDAKFKQTLTEIEACATASEAISLAESAIGEERWMEEGKHQASFKRTLERRFA